MIDGTNYLFLRVLRHLNSLRHVSQYRMNIYVTMCEYGKFAPVNEVLLSFFITTSKQKLIDIGLWHTFLTKSCQTFSRLKHVICVVCFYLFLCCCTLFRNSYTECINVVCC